MKTSVCSVRATIVTFLISFGLLSSLSGCSLFGTKAEAPQRVSAPPISQSVDADSTATADSAEQGARDSQATTDAQAIRLKESHPRQYTVKKGDTLWDIASLFLQDPWYWPEIWQRNPQVQNPHLIFPGDVLTLIYIDGQPQILVNQSTTTASHATATAIAEGLPIKKLSPVVRRDDLAASIPTIPSDAIRQFTTRPRVVTKEELEAAPYILGSDDEHLVLGQGNRVYIRGELDKERVRFTVFRPGAELVDPDTDEVFGYEAIYAGEVFIKKYGDPAVGELVATEREVLIGDRLLPQDKGSLNNLYFPKLPDRNLSGKVISLFDALFGIAKYQVAVINIGSRDGLEVGNLLATYTQGQTLDDNYTSANSRVKLPDERSGLMMIFRTFDQVSYGLIMESTNVIHKYDVVVTPR